MIQMAICEYWLEYLECDDLQTTYGITMGEYSNAPQNFF